MSRSSEEYYGVGKKVGSVDESEESEGKAGNVEMSEASYDRDGSVSEEDSNASRESCIARSLFSKAVIWE